MKIFLSYSPEEAKGVPQIIGRRLSAKGFEVWDPAMEVFPGDNWAKAMGQALDQSDAMIVFMTDQYSDSTWSWQDFSYALGNERFRDRVVRVVFEDQGDVRDDRWLKGLPQVKWDKDNPHKVVEAIEHALKSPV